MPPLGPPDQVLFVYDGPQQGTILLFVRRLCQSTSGQQKDTRNVLKQGMGEWIDVGSMLHIGWTHYGMPAV